MTGRGSTTFPFLPPFFLSLPLPAQRRVDQTTPHLTSLAAALASAAAPRACEGTRGPWERTALRGVVRRRRREQVREQPHTPEADQLSGGLRQPPHLADLTSGYGGG